MGRTPSIFLLENACEMHVHFFKEKCFNFFPLVLALINRVRQNFIKFLHVNKM
jgi:hypothetical protein